MSDTLTTEASPTLDGGLDKLLNQHFAGKVVRKDLTKLIKEGANVPVYVLEYLLGMYCASDDAATIETGLETVKRVLAAHDELTLTGLYNVLTALRDGRALTAKEKAIYTLGLVGVLRELHDELDAAVLAAYGWPTGLTDEEILARLLALNLARAGVGLQA